MRRALYVAILSGATFIGANISSASKPTVLFLRRFGLDSNLVVSRVFRSGLGRRYRLITLDDDRFPPLDTPDLERWALRLAVPGAVLIFILWSVFLFSQVQGVLDYGPQLHQEAVIMVGFWLLYMWSLLVFALAHLWRIRHKSTAKITSERGLRRVLCEVASWRGFLRRMTMLAPQTMIVRVSNQLWQTAVSAVSSQIDLTLVEISDPTENLKWEIEHLRASAKICVFIASNSHFRVWKFHLHGNYEGGQPAAAIANLVGEDPVLLYDCEHELGGPTFRSSLLELLRAAEVNRRQHFSSLPGRSIHCIREFSFYSACAIASILAGLPVVMFLLTIILSLEK